MVQVVGQTRTFFRAGALEANLIYGGRLGVFQNGADLYPWQACPFVGALLNFERVEILREQPTRDGVHDATTERIGATRRRRHDGEERRGSKVLI